MKEKIAVVVPTIRPESWVKFLEAWQPLFDKHKVGLFKVDDSGDSPVVQFIGSVNPPHKIEWASNKPWLFNKSDCCRNAGFFAAWGLEDYNIIISLDDDVFPIPGTDPIQDHIDALNMEVMPNWISTAQAWRVRGIPVGGEKWPVMLSHGVWAGVPDFDAPTQFLNPDVRDIAFNKTNVPKGVLFPLCAMNFAFRRELIPYVYQAPMGQRLAEFGLPVGDRFADIWAGVVMKLACDENKWGVVTGYSTIYHSRASNVFTNLKKESGFLEQNETFLNDWQDQKTKNEYVLLYRTKLAEWQRAVAG